MGFISSTGIKSSRRENEPPVAVYVEKVAWGAEVGQVSCGDGSYMFVRRKDRDCLPVPGIAIFAIDKVETVNYWAVWKVVKDE